MQGKTSLRTIPAPLFTLSVPGYISSLSSYPPGKPVEETARELGLKPQDIVKLASNENPLGPSKRALLAASSLLGKSHIYPDAKHFELKQAISEYLHVAPDQIVVGNGSNEVIDLVIRVFCRPGDTIVAPKYSFVAYRLCAQLHGCQYKEAELDGEFELSVDRILKAVDKSTKLVFLANPNNPTGAWLPESEVKRLALELAQRGVILVLDAAYQEFTQSPGPGEPLNVLGQCGSVIVLRTFSKAQGLAGFRVGYGVSSQPIADLLDRARQPFNVSALGLVAAVEALKDNEHVLKTVENNNAGRVQLLEGLKAMGISAYGKGQGNFLLIDLKRDASAVFDGLLKRGVIVRPVKNYGLPQHIRVSVGMSLENERFLSALQQTVST